MVLVNLFERTILSNIGMINKPEVLKVFQTLLNTEVLSPVCVPRIKVCWCRDMSTDSAEFDGVQGPL